MRARFVAGYVLIFLGLLASIYIGIWIARALAAPPAGGGAGGIGGALLAGLGIAIGVGIYMVSGLILLVPGTLLVRSHESRFRVLIGTILLIVSLGLAFYTAASAIYAQNLSTIITLFLLLSLFHIPASGIAITGKAPIGLIIFILIIILTAVAALI